jgi:probable phosphomutase (TIGR03848 family)
MPTTIYLIRHAAHDLLGRILTGRMEGVGLSEKGRRQSELLAQTLSTLPITVVYSSPLQRAYETAAPLAKELGLTASISQDLTEFDFGDWTGREFSSFAQDPLWRAFNTFRSRIRAPNGEAMLDVQARVVAFLEGIPGRHPEARVAVVSHGDVLKAAVLHYLGATLDSFLRVELDPASVSVLEVAPWGARILALNDRRPSEDLE